MQYRPTSAHIHIPFVPRFVTIVTFPRSLLKNQPVDDYLKALMEEVRHYKSQSSRPLTSEGTPFGSLAEQLITCWPSWNMNWFFLSWKNFIHKSAIWQRIRLRSSNPAIAVLISLRAGVQTLTTRCWNASVANIIMSQIYETIDSLSHWFSANISIDLIMPLPGSDHGPGGGQCS